MAFSNQKSGEEDETLTPNLHSLINSHTLKWIFVGGKGGVGKTTTACSIAVQLAKKRDSVLIISTDPAHNLSDAFGQKFTSQPTKVKGFNNLDAMEIEQQTDEEVGFRQHDTYGLAKLIPEFTSTLPGIEEALSLATLMQSVRTMNYSTIVFDTAPTGHTLRLLAFPDLLEKGLNKLSSINDKFSNALNLLSTFTNQSNNDMDISTTLNNLSALINFVRHNFRDPSITTFVCVCIPEFLSVYETERLIQELTNQRIDCFNIVVNQVQFPLEYHEKLSGFKAQNSMCKFNPNSTQNLSLEDENKHLKQVIKNLEKKLETLNSIYVSRRLMQSKYLKMIEDLYSFDFHVVTMPQLSNEVRGCELIENFGDLLLQSKPIPSLVDLNL